MEIFHYLGLAVAAIGWLWFLVVIFRRSLGWGLASLLLPFAGLVAAIAHWDAAKKPVITWLAGLAIIIGNVMMSPTLPATV